MTRIDISKKLQAGTELFDNKAYPAAVAILEQIYKKSPESVKGLNALFLICQSKNFLKSSDQKEYWMKLSEKKDLLITKELSFYYETALYEIALLFLEEKNFDQAREYFKLLIKDRPNSSLADNSIFQLALLFKKENKLDGATKILQSIIEKYPDSDILEKIQKEKGNINIALLFSPHETKYTQAYIIKPGDSLALIAKNFNTTVEFIKKANRMEKATIRPTDRLIVPKVKFSIVVDKSKNTLTLKGDEQVIKVYSVGTGKYNKTPIGNFYVTTKLIDPPWYSKEGLIPSGDKRNLLGTRWLGINVTSYGIHGTTQPETIGSQSSEGCIRMLNEEVEELYSIVPENTEVIIID